MFTLFNEEDLHCSSEAIPSWTEPVSNDSMLSSLDLQSSLTDLTLGRWPTTILRSYLHEATHHWCFQSVLGSMLSMLWLRTFTNAYRLKDINGDDAWDIVDDLTRYWCTVKLMRPLAEGLAMFSEHDLYPAKSEVSPPFLTFATLAFSNQLITQKPLAECEEHLSEALAGMRLRKDGVQKKASLLVSALSTNNGGYLAGYLTVKTIWGLLIRKSPKFLDAPFYLTFMHDFFYGDLALVRDILDPKLHDFPLANQISMAFQNKFSMLLRITQEQIDDFEKRFTKSRAEENGYHELTRSTGFERLKTPFYGADPDKVVEGTHLLQKMLIEIDSIPVSDEIPLIAKRALSTIASRRNLMRLGRKAMPVRCSQGRLTVFSNKELDANLKIPIAAISALDGAPDFEGDAIVEFFVSMAPPLAFATIKKDEKCCLAYITTANGENEKKVKSYANTSSDIFTSLKPHANKLFDWATSDPTIKSVFEQCMKDIDHVTQQIYVTRAVPSSREDISELIKTMGQRGFWEILGQDEQLVLLISIYSLCTSLQTSATEAFLKLHGLRDKHLTNRLDSLLKSQGMDILLGKGVERLCLAV